MTSQQVLYTYRNILRQISRFPDPLAKTQLLGMARDEFSSRKYVTDIDRIKGLHDVACNDLQLLEQANKGKHKAMKEVLDRAFFSVGTRRSPMHKLITGRTNDVDRADPAYIFNNLTVPATATFAEHRQSTAQTSPLHNFISILSGNRMSTGPDGRKLPLKIEERFTVLGNRLALSRQRNVIRRAYGRIIRDSPKPVHMSVIEHIHSQLHGSTKLPRQYRRRLQDCMREYYALKSTEKGYKVVRAYQLPLDS